MVDIIQNFIRLFLAMHESQILLNPLYQMIFEHALDELVEYVWCKQFVNVCSREFAGERLMYMSIVLLNESKNTHTDATDNAIFIPCDIEPKGFDHGL